MWPAASSGHEKSPLAYLLVTHSICSVKGGDNVCPLASASGVSIGENTLPNVAMASAWMPKAVGGGIR